MAAHRRRMPRAYIPISISIAADAYEQEVAQHANQD